MIEAQVDYLMRALEWRRQTGLSAVEVRPDAQARFVDEVDRGTKGSVWTAGGCLSWYLDATGRNSTLWPGSVRAYQRRLSRFDEGDYRVWTLRPEPAPAREPVPALA
jgi:hypothetical protein